MAGQFGDLAVAGQCLQRAVVIGLARLHQAGQRRPLVEAFQQGADRIEAQPGVAPVEPGQRIEAVGFDRLDDLGVERPLFGGGAKGAVAHMPPGAAGDLGDLGGGQPARAAAVEFADAGKGDMVEIHVEAHADRIGGDQIVDLAGLEHADLGVARPRRQRAQHHRGAAALAADQLGQGEHIGDGKGDDGAARRQPRHLFLAGIGKRRKTRPADMLDLRDQPAHQRLDRVGAEKHGLGEAARVQQAGGKDVAALRIGAELDLVDREEIDRPVERHRFDGAHEIGRVGRQDLFFAGDQRHRAGAPQPDDAVIVLARQQAQRKPDHPALMAEHALDREMGLAGIGRPEDRDEPRSRAEHGHGQRYRAAAAIRQAQTKRAIGDATPRP